MGGKHKDVENEIFSLDASRLFGRAIERENWGSNQGANPCLYSPIITEMGRPGAWWYFAWVTRSPRLGGLEYAMVGRETPSSFWKSSPQCSL